MDTPESHKSKEKADQKKQKGIDRRKSLNDPNVEKVRRTVKESPLSLNRLATLAGIEHGQISRFVEGERDVSLHAFGQLLRVLHLTIKGESDQKNESGVTGTEAPAPPIDTPPTVEEVREIFAMELLSVVFRSVILEQRSPSETAKEMRCSSREVELLFHILLERLRLLFIGKKES